VPPVPLSAVNLLHYILYKQWQFSQEIIHRNAGGSTPGVLYSREPLTGRGAGSKFAALFLMTRQQAPYLRPLSPVHRFHRNTHIRGGCLVVIPPSTRRLHPTATTGTHPSISCPVRPFRCPQQAAPSGPAPRSTGTPQSRAAAAIAEEAVTATSPVLHRCEPRH
jgi:hypothetical protein